MRIVHTIYYLWFPENNNLDNNYVPVANYRMLYIPRLHDTAYINKSDIITSKARRPVIITKHLFGTTIYWA